MNPSLPVVSGRQVIKVLESIGYVEVRQRGSHVRLRHPDAETHRPVTVPLHNEIKRGLLRAIIRDSGLAVGDFLSHL